MIKFTQITLKNFQSIKEATINLPDSGLILIEGWNHDDQTANGAGKSTIFNGLFYGLYGSHVRSISAIDLFHPNTSEFEVVISGRSNNGDRIICRRGRNSKGKIAQFTSNDEEISEHDFLKILGISADHFKLVQYFSQNNTNRFLDLNDSAKKELILKIVDIDKFIEIKEKVDTDLKQLIKIKDGIESSIKDIDNKLSFYKEETVEESSVLSDSLAKHQDVCQKAVLKVKELEKNNKPDVSKFNDILIRLNKELDTIKELEWSAASLRKQLKQIDLSPIPQDSPDTTCPVCSSNLDIVGAELLVHDSNSHQAKIIAHEDEKLKIKSKLVAEIKDIESKVIKKIELESTIASLQDKRMAILADYKTIDARVGELRAFIKQCEASISSIEEKIQKQEKLVIKINQQKQQLVEENEKLLININKISKLSSLSNILSPTGIQAYVLDSVLDDLNFKIADNLTIMWPNATFKILSFKEKKDGTASAKMGEHLEVGGIVKSLSTLSGGERKALSLAIDLALVETFSNYMGLSVDPLILDEPFDGMDHINRTRVIELLQVNSLKRLIFVVDHSAEAKSLFDNTLQVSKRNGISSISW